MISLQGTEVKAITYSAMQIYEKEEKPQIFVIIDIWEGGSLLAHAADILHMILMPETDLRL